VLASLTRTNYKYVRRALAQEQDRATPGIKLHACTMQSRCCRSQLITWQCNLLLRRRLAPCGRPPTDQQRKTRLGPEWSETPADLSVAVDTPVERDDVSDVDKSIVWCERPLNQDHPLCNNCATGNTWTCLKEIRTFLLDPLRPRPRYLVEVVLGLPPPSTPSKVSLLISLLKCRSVK